MTTLEVALGPAVKQARKIKPGLSLVAIEPEMLDKANAAAFLGVSESSFENILKDIDSIKPRQVGKCMARYLVSELRDYANTRPIANFLPPKNTGAKKPKVSTL